MRDQILDMAPGQSLLATVDKVILEREKIEYITDRKLARIVFARAGFSRDEGILEGEEVKDIADALAR